MTKWNTGRMPHDPWHDGDTAVLAEQRRVYDDTQFILIELDPALVLDGERAPYEIDRDLHLFGQMRETCPECVDTHLQLVLRQKHVKIAHLYCQRCKRCFDACYPNGVSALAVH